MQAGALESCQASYSKASRITLFGTQSWQHETLLLSLLVDSGAVASQSSVAIVELSEPVTFSDLDGKLPATVTHHMIPLSQISETIMR